MEGGRNAQFQALGPNRIVLILAVEPQHIVPQRITARFRSRFSHRRDGAALQAG